METIGMLCAAKRHIMSIIALLMTTAGFAQLSFINHGSLLLNEQANTETNTVSAVATRILGAPLIITNNAEANDASNNIRFVSTPFEYPKNSNHDIGSSRFENEQLMLYAKGLKQYARQNGFDTTYVFLGNMGMLSDKKRFFVINLDSMQIEMSGLVSHGRGPGQSLFDKQYSNESGSKCTSLGRYKVFGKYRGGYGTAYKMEGLDSSNDNAYSRRIVLHAMECIPDIENAMPACVSEGCPAVSARFFESLTKIIDSRKKPVLLWLFDSNMQKAIIEETPANIQTTRPVYNGYTLK